MKGWCILFLSPNGESALSGYTGNDHLFVTEVKSIDGAKRELLARSYDLFVSRCEAFDRAQAGLLQFVKHHDLSAKTIVVPKRASVDDAVQAIKLGAWDLFTQETMGKDFVEQLLEREDHADEAAPAVSRGPAGDENSILIGQSHPMQEILPAIELVAKSEAAVFITGESGTGKEVVARLIHRRSRRSSQPFVALNCAAFPKDVIENELFGHERGAFTGAIAMKSGAFEFADSGTLFFDEIGEMNPEIQAKLLRAIEQKAFRRLGGKEEVHVDVRIIAATNKNITAALESGELREDLYYRFSVIEIALPPLRDRIEDIPLLAEHFLSMYSSRYGRPQQHFSEQALELLRSFLWPGNVRELKNVVERAVVTCPSDVIGVEDLPPRISRQKPAESSVVIPVGSTFEEAERKIVLHTLASVHNNKSKAARMLGVSRQTLLNKLRRFNAEAAQPSDHSS